MKIWRYTWRDSFLLSLSILQSALMFIVAYYWHEFSVFNKFISFTLITFMMTYNIIVISHLFTHTPWFNSSLLNGIVSMLNSFNIGQSVQAYQLTHVRNHHRYNNDQQNSQGKTQDTSSTFRDGKNNEHDSVWHYAFSGALSSFLKSLKDLWAVTRLWRIDESYENNLLELLARDPQRQAMEYRQLRLDHFAHFFGIMICLSISWQWTLMCYLPAFYLALALVNIQNYYEHYGALPGDLATNSVSYYGKIYNLFAFNDGHHQEHHLRPGAHWSTMPQVRENYAQQLDCVRIISPVPAILGFLDRKRPLLHHIKHHSIQQSISIDDLEAGDLL